MTNPFLRKIMTKFRFLTSLLLYSFFSISIFAEVIYMKDGQIYNGAVVKENKQFIWVKTKYLEKKLDRKNILRVLYGERDLEQIYIQLKDGRIISGYLVDQDNKKIVIRLQKSSKDETTIIKTNITQMSRDKIIPLDPDFFISPGWFNTLNTSSGANLDPGIHVQLGMGIAIPAIKQLRISFLLGYLTQSANFLDTKGKTSTLSLQAFPLAIQGFYSFNWYDIFFKSKSKVSKIKKSIPKGVKKESSVSLEDDNLHWSQRFFFETGLSLGSAFMLFDNGEGESFSGLKFFGEVNLGVKYEVMKRKLYLSILTNQQFYIEETGSILLELGITTRISYKY